MAAEASGSAGSSARVFNARPAKTGKGVELKSIDWVKQEAVWALIGSAIRGKEFVAPAKSR